MTKPFHAVHVGRRGEVAGGMTQVVNGYLGWDFDSFDSRVIVSRDGSTGLRAAMVAVGAARRILALRSAKTTVVVVHLSQGGSFLREGALLRLARIRGAAVVAQLHGSSFAAFARARPRLVSSVLRAADIVLTLSSETTGAVERLIPGAPVTQVPNAVASGSPRQKEKLVVFGGAVGRRKGVDVLLDAWRGIADPDGWTLLIAGPVVDADVVPESGREGVAFLGAVTHDELLELLDRTSIAVLPSRDEAMPMFILEALARRACVVASEVGGVPAVLSGGAGVLVAPGDAQALSRELGELISDETRRTTIAVQGRRIFDARFSAEAVFPSVEAAWNTALERRRER